MKAARGTWWLGSLGTAVMVASLAFAPASEANVYKWKDPSGNIHYTDKPPPADGVLISIEKSTSTRREESRATPTAASTNRGGSSADSMTPGAQAQLRNTVQKDVENAQNEGCKQAKERYQMYVQSRRLFKEGPNKERVYLSDQELEQARLNAKHDMDETCGAQ